MPADFVNALRRHSLEVQDLEGDKADEFLRLLKQLKEDVRGRMLASGNPGASFDSFALMRVERETQAAISTLELKAKGAFTTTQRDALDMSFEHMGDEIDSLSRVFDGKTLDVTLDAAKALADPAQKLLANHFDTSVARYGGDLLNGVRQQLFIAVRTGDPLREVAANIASERGPMGTVGQANAERLVRTEVSQAYGAAQHSGLTQAAKQVPGLKKTWLHIGSYVCPVCIPLHGTSRPLDGTWTIKQGSRTREVAHAPSHPNCGCRVVGMKQKWNDGLKKLGYLTDDPKNLTSPRPVSITAPTSVSSGIGKVEFSQPHDDFLAGEDKKEAGEFLKGIFGRVVTQKQIADLTPPPPGVTFRFGVMSPAGKNELGTGISVINKTKDVIGDIGLSYRKVGNLRSVNIDEMYVSPKMRGQGIGAAITDNMVNGWREDGFDQVTLETHDVGRYHWAKSGFDWETEAYREYKEKELFSFLENKGIPDAARKAKEWTKTPRILANSPYGKEFLTNSMTANWQGVLKL